MSKKRLKISPKDTGLLTIFEIAMCEDPEELVKRLAIESDEAGILRAGMVMVATYWIAGMDDDQRARIDPEIVSRFKSDHAADTALLLLRDMVNAHMPMARFYMDIDPSATRKVSLGTKAINPDEVSMIWRGAALEIIGFDSSDQLHYSLCQQCGRPFQHKSTRALYCSASCRVAASRARK